MAPLTFNILKPSFTPIPPDYYDIFLAEQEKPYTKVYYFASGTTINGKPGPAYDEYDRYGLACLDCGGGMDDE